MSSGGKRPRFLAPCNTAAKPQPLHTGVSRPLKSHPGNTCGDREMQGEPVSCCGMVTSPSLQSLCFPWFSCCCCISLSGGEKLLGQRWCPRAVGRGGPVCQPTWYPIALCLSSLGAWEGTQSNTEKSGRVGWPQSPKCLHFPLDPDRNINRM